jgi:hypothetical protein
MRKGNLGNEDAEIVDVVVLKTARQLKVKNGGAIGSSDVILDKVNGEVLRILLPVPCLELFVSAPCRLTRSAPHLSIRTFARQQL